MENEENVKEVEVKEAETDATEQKDTTNKTEEKSPSTEIEAKEEANPDSEKGTEETPVDPVVPEQIVEEQKQYTTELVGNDNFTLEIAHQITAGDMLVSTLLAANIAVLLLCRLIRDRK